MKDFVESYWEKDALPALMEFGKIPNVSPAYDPDWEKNGHMERAATMLLEWVKGRNLVDVAELHIIPGKTPLLYFEIEGTKEGTVLMYGHFDKQPELTGWREGLGPWTPVREGDYLYGRGLADDGYSTFAAVGAIEAAKNSGAELPRIVILIEGSEESGSDDLPAYLEMLKSKIGSPHTVITLDAEGWDPDHLWLTESLRGLINGHLTVQILDVPLHSGLATGIVPSATRILRMLLSRIENTETGLVTNTIVSPEIPEDVAEKFNRVADVVGDEYIQAYHLPSHLQTAGSDLKDNVKRNLWDAGMEVTGFTGLPHPEKAGNVTNAKVHAKLSFRIPPTVDCKEAAQELKRVFEENPPYGAKVTFDSKEMDNGWISNDLSPKGKIAIWEAAKETYGNEPIQTGIGASIPFIGMMGREFPNADNLVTGILSPSSNAHGPDENLHIPTVKRITEWTARFLAKI